MTVCLVAPLKSRLSRPVKTGVILAEWDSCRSCSLVGRVEACPPISTSMTGMPMQILGGRSVRRSESRAIERVEVFAPAGGLLRATCEVGAGRAISWPSSTTSTCERSTRSSRLPPAWSAFCGSRPGCFLVSSWPACLRKVVELSIRRSGDRFARSFGQEATRAGFERIHEPPSLIVRRTPLSKREAICSFTAAIAVSHAPQSYSAGVPLRAAIAASTRFLRNAMARGACDAIMATVALKIW